MHIPVTILTGFLGSGKTTFINHVLRERHGQRLAIVENEFGEVGIDGGLVMSTDDEVIEMMNGCICCTVRNDLIKALEALFKRRDKFDAVIIETTGLADPAPVAQTFFVNEDIQQKFYLDSIVTFVDCKHILTHIDEEKPEGVENEAVEQVAFADILILNKTDLVSVEATASLSSRLRRINATAKIIQSQHSAVPLAGVLGIRAFDLKSTLLKDEAFLDTGGEHLHDASVTSVGICIVGEFKPDLFHEWIGRLLNERGVDIFRSKGIIAVLGSDERYAFQGVHMLMDMSPLQGQNWKLDEKRTNKLCFIGRNLNRQELTEGLLKCIFNGTLPDPGLPPSTELRFNVGDLVSVRCGDWKPGVVTKVWYREPLWETGHFAPFQVQCEDGSYVFAPHDLDSFIRPRV